MNLSAFETSDALDILRDQTLLPQEKLGRLFELFASTQQANGCLAPGCLNPAVWCSACAVADAAEREEA